MASTENNRNESGTKRQHAAVTPSGPQVPEPSHAERVRTLVSRMSVATLSTMSRKLQGFPFGSLMPYALDVRGRPIFLISNMAMHTQNLKADARASLFVTQSAADGDALGAARATLMGRAEPVGTSDRDDARERYLLAHENSRYWVDFADFGFFRLEIAEVYYVGGFGVMGWVSAPDYGDAEPDPLAASAEGILQHMNADHAEAMILLARSHAGLEATQAAMTSVDRLGFWMRLKTAEGIKGARVNYAGQARTPEQVRAAMVALVRAARTNAT